MAEEKNRSDILDFRKQSQADQHSSWELSKPVFFVGFMGAGKTSVARKLARYAGVADVDMDTYIERYCDMKVSRIFEEVGEEGFRAIETDVLRKLAQEEPRLISCGGGVVLSEENRRLLRDHGFVVHLQVTAAEAASRISDTSTRPLFGDLDQAERVSAARFPLYEEVADASIDTTGKSASVLAQEAMETLKEEGILWQPK